MSRLDVTRSVERVGRHRWKGTISYRAADASDSGDPPVPPFTLVLMGAYGCLPTARARSLKRLTRKLDEVEGALHRRHRDRERSDG